MTQTRRDSKDILEAIDQYWEQYHYGPTLEEISVSLGTVKSNTLYHLRKLRQEGQVLFEDNTPRSLRTSKTDCLIEQSFRSKTISDQEVLGRMSEICEESLSPGRFAMWEELLAHLVKTRRNPK